MLRYVVLALYAALIVNILIIIKMGELELTGNPSLMFWIAVWGWVSAVAGIPFLWNKRIALVLSGIGLILSGGIIGAILGWTAIVWGRI
jgi:hypothetical protein